MIHTHSTFHVDLMCAPATYRFTDSQKKGGMGGMFSNSPYAAMP